MPKKKLSQEDKTDKVDKESLEEDSDTFEKDDYKDFLKEYHVGDEDHSEDSDSWSEEEAGQLKEDDL